MNWDEFEMLLTKGEGWDCQYVLDFLEAQDDALAELLETGSVSVTAGGHKYMLSLNVQVLL